MWYRRGFYVLLLHPDSAGISRLIADPNSWADPMLDWGLVQGGVFHMIWGSGKGLLIFVEVIFNDMDLKIEQPENKDYILYWQCSVHICIGKYNMIFETTPMSSRNLWIWALLRIMSPWTSGFLWWWAMLIHILVGYHGVSKILIHCSRASKVRVYHSI